jgi:cytochrome c peroxidase
MAAPPDAGSAMLSTDEVRAVAELGPWPPAVARDPGNRVSGDRKAIELGRQLFRDPRMSPVGYIACVTCHQPDRAFTDIKARAHGLADLPRNTPALANLGLQRWYGWGGGSDSLWMASIKPILDAREFDGNAQLVRRLFVREPELAACYRSVFGVSALRGDVQRTVVNVGKALAAFVETLVTARTPFDDFRDAVVRGDAAAAAATYPASALRGLKFFVGRGGCVSCHGGSNFTDGMFHPGVVPPDRAAAALSLTDSGRLDDARALKASVQPDRRVQRRCQSAQRRGHPPARGARRPERPLSHALAAQRDRHRAVLSQRADRTSDRCGAARAAAVACRSARRRGVRIDAHRRSRRASAVGSERHVALPVMQPAQACSPRGRWHADPFAGGAKRQTGAALRPTQACHTP